jgi:hypothetical protein
VQVSSCGTCSAGLDLQGMPDTRVQLCERLQQGNTDASFDAIGMWWHVATTGGWKMCRPAVESVVALHCP